MNISVCDSATVEINVSIVSDDEYTDRAGVTRVLNAWVKAVPAGTRGWMLLDSLYVITEREADEADSVTLAETDDDLYSLDGLARVLDALSGTGRLAWGDGIGEPNAATQAAVIAGIDRRVEVGGMPQNLHNLRQLVIAAMGEAGVR
ncbi:hypothetical protein SEA_KOZIE_42 [Microbacterium phage Kozie]|uniref:Uncharacterized protein n=1 Tax=Microbacterium phage Kozie TaxID=2885981 RepID=A0AAE8Y882_9CAUD|nr:hypothetical protein QC998_gp42 [Microbacterium phage Kozie]UDL16238.1 hypothetical protein SEA_KOZIE_42 [Microbacterium phage Kozie]